MNRIFISYSSKEYDIACNFRKAFSERGINCWMAPESIPIGSNYAVEIPKAIQDADIFVLILSDNSQNSVWVRKEIDLAVNLNKLIFPIKTGNYQLISPFSFYLTDVQMMQANDDQNIIADKLCSMLNPSNNDEDSVSSEEPVQPTAPAPQPVQFTRNATSAPEKKTDSRKLIPIISAAVVSVVLIVCTVLLLTSLNSKAPQVSEQDNSSISETTAPAQTTTPKETTAKAETTAKTTTTTKKAEETTAAPKQETNTYFAVYYEDNEYFNKYDIEIYVNDEYYGSVTQGDTKLFKINAKSGKYVIKAVNSNKSSKYDSQTVNMDASDEHYYLLTAKAGWTGIHLNYVGTYEF